MKNKEDCPWCMSTQHIERKICEGMPEEFKYRCSACHEEWAEGLVEEDGGRNIRQLQEKLTKVEEKELSKMPKSPFRCIEFDSNSVWFTQTDCFTWDEAERLYVWFGKMLGKEKDYDNKS